MSRVWSLDEIADAYLEGITTRAETVRILDNSRIFHTTQGRDLFMQRIDEQREAYAKALKGSVR